MILALLHLAKSMRSGATEAEAVLWKELRAGRLLGFKFKRQQPIENYIVDFVCFEQKLIVELDGGQHADSALAAADAARTQWLKPRDIVCCDSGMTKRSIARTTFWRR